MTMMKLLRPAGATVVFVLTSAAIAGAQSWSWTYTDPGMQSSHGLSAATLDLSATQIKTQNRVAIAGRPDVVYGCTIKLDDVSRAIAVHTGTTSLLISLKPGKSAKCQIIGQPQSVVLRADDGGMIDRIAQKINTACCSVAALPSPTPEKAKAKIATPAPAKVTAKIATPAPEKVTAKIATPAPEKVTAKTATPAPEKVTAKVATPSPAPVPERTTERTAVEPTAVPRHHAVAQLPPTPKPRRTPAVTSFIPDSGPRLVRPGVSEPVPGKTGIVRIAMLLGPDGSPQDARVVSSTNDDLDDAGIEIAVSSIYAPAVRGRRPVSSDFFVTVSFTSGEPSIDATVSAR
jgi:outer membrane biosynthesis protein TonB